MGYDISTQQIRPSVGDILYSSWGYEQTNIDFYQVVEVTKASVRLREIAKEVVESVGWCSDMVAPLKNAFIGDKFIKRFRPSSYNEYAVRMNSYSSAWKWDGRPLNQTSYA